MRCSAAKFLRLMLLTLLLSAVPASAYGRIEASGRGVAPLHASAAQAKLLARRGAILDLYRNLLRYSSAEGGVVRGVRLLNERWDGRTYTVTGFVGD